MRILAVNIAELLYHNKVLMKGKNVE